MFFLVLRNLLYTLESLNSLFSHKSRKLKLSRFTLLAETLHCAKKLGNRCIVRRNGSAVDLDNQQWLSIFYMGFFK